jgi:hypothetical protein
MLEADDPSAIITETESTAKDIDDAEDRSTAE